METVVDTDDLDVACQVLTDAYAGLRLTVSGGRHHLRVARGRLGSVELRRSTFSMRLIGEGQPIHRLGFARLHRGTVERSAGGCDVAGDVFLLNQPDESYRVTVDVADVETVFFDPDVLREVTDTGSGCRFEPVRFIGRRPTCARAAQMWVRAQAHVRDVVLDHPAAHEPLLAGAAVRMLAATALAVFPNTSVREPTAADRRDAHPVALARALAYIDDNAHRDLSDAEVAAAARVSIRSLRLAFERHLGVTVAGHLGRVRLALAHHDLSTADPAGATVATVAARWGFADAHSFAAQYRVAYGVSPEFALRRG